MTRTHERPGYALLAVLGFLAGIASLSLLAILAGRGSLMTTANRAALLRAEWRAEACIARARAALLAFARDTARPAAAHELRGRVRDAVLGDRAVRDCPGRVLFEPVGARVDVNRASAGLLTNVLVRHGIPSVTAESLVAALLDWRDGDDTTRALGAEREWYRARGERTPRDAELSDLRELSLVRGFEHWLHAAGSNLQQVLTTERGGLVLELAPLELLQAVPGMEMTALAAIDRYRRGAHAHLPLRSALEVLLQPAEHESFRRVLSESSTDIAEEPEAWILRATSSGIEDAPADARLTATVELLLIPDGRRFAVARRRIGT